MAKDQKFPGGLLVGETDKNGGKGIKVVAPEGNIIVGGGELVLTSDTGKSNKKHEFDGKKMTPCEIASELNQEGGGVKIPCQIAEPANTTDSKMEVGDVIKKAATGTKIPFESNEDKIERLKRDLIRLQVHGEGDTHQAKVIKNKILVLNNRIANSMAFGGITKEEKDVLMKAKNIWIDKKNEAESELRKKTSAEDRIKYNDLLDQANQHIASFEKGSMEKGGHIQEPYTVEQWALMLKEFYEYNNIDYSGHTTEMIERDLKASPYGSKLDNKDAWDLALEIERYFEKGSMQAGGSIIEKARLKYAKQDINLLQKEGHMAITDTQVGVLWGSHKNGIFEFLSSNEGIMFKGNKTEAINFLKGMYTVEMATGGKTQLQTGIEVEKEHRDLYERVKKMFEANGKKMPISENEFYKTIAKAHLREDKYYYDKLLKYVEGERKENGTSIQVPNNWEVYYIDNSGQKKVIKDNLFYHQAVKMSQEKNRKGLNADFEPMPKN